MGRTAFYGSALSYFVFKVPFSEHENKLISICNKGDIVVS